MSIKIEELMIKNPISVSAHATVGHATTIFKNNKINLLPVVDGDNFVKGVISSRDIISNENENIPVNQIMTTDVFSISSYENIEIAARMMRNHHIHHLVVTHEKKLEGIISSFDLLKLVEGKRFVMKNPSTPNKQKKSKKNQEAGLV